MKWYTRLKEVKKPQGKADTRMIRNDKTSRYICFTLEPSINSCKYWASIRTRRMKIAVLFVIVIAFGNAQETKKGTTLSHMKEECPENICNCEIVRDNSEPTVYYMMATCTEVPTHLGDHIRYLKVTGQIDDVTRKMITGLGINLRQLDFSNCKIEKIEKGAFGSSLKHLKHLILSDNKLTELDEDIFQCPNLEKLFLDKNNIKKIHDDSFQQLAQLKFLYLQHNMLRKCSFKLPTNVSQLDLYDNEIQSFEVDLNQVQLNHLDLCGNNFKQFPFKDSTKNTNLNSLCLSGKASYLPQGFAARFPQISNLTLEGSNSHINEFDDKTQNEIKNLANIITLTIEYFHIQSLEFIINKNKLTNLSLRNVTLRNKAGVQNVFRTMSYLNYLCIDHSPDLVKPMLGDESTVSHLSRLHHLSIQHTKLKSITKHNIPPSVVQLNIAYNPLRCDCKLSWIVAKHNTSPGRYLQDVAHTTCSTPAQYDERELLNVVNPTACSGNSDGMLEQEMMTTPEEQGQQKTDSDHTLLYIILGSCLIVLLVVGITLAIVLSVMKKKRKLQIAPEGGETPMEQQQQMKQSSSHDMLLKK